MVVVRVSEKWRTRFMEMAEMVSTWSKDPSRHVGCVVARDRHVVGMGYNGFPPGVYDDARLETRMLKNELMVHAEMNSVLNAARLGVSLEGCDVYVYGLPPCLECAKALATARVRSVCAPAYEGVLHAPWDRSCGRGAEILLESRIWVYAWAEAPYGAETYALVKPESVRQRQHATGFLSALRIHPTGLREEVPSASYWWSRKYEETT